jgi:hypothetical protein
VLLLHAPVALSDTAPLPFAFVIADGIQDQCIPIGDRLGSSKTEPCV